MDNTTKGYLLALGSAVVGGTIPVTSKLVVENADPVTSSGLAFLFAGLLLLPYRPKSFPRRNNTLLILVAALFGSAMAPTLYLTGVRQTSAVTAALLANSEIFFTAIIGFSLFNESLKRRQLAEGLLIVAGVIVISTNLQFGVSLVQGLAGNVLIVASTIFWSVDNNLSRVASQRAGVSIVAKYKSLFGGAATLLFLAASSGLVVPLQSLPLILMLAASFAATTLFSVAALRIIGAVRTLLVFSASSVFGPLFAFLIIGEGITPVQVIGGALILSGVYLIQRSEEPPTIPSDIQQTNSQSSD